jgi:gas vesicle protein
MSDDGKTELEFAGVKFRGGKIFVIITALSTLGGGLYGAFEFYKDYMDMKEKIQTYVAPDLSGFDKKLAVLKEEMQGVTTETKSKVEVIEAEFSALITETKSKVEVIETEFQALKTEVESFGKEIHAFEKLEEGIKQTAEDARDYTKDIKRDLKNELHVMSEQVDDIERRGKEAFRLVRESIEINDTKVRKMVTDSSDRFDKRREQLRNDMDVLELRVKSEIKELKKTINDKIKKALENPLANMRK